MFNTRFDIPTGGAGAVNPTQAPTQQPQQPAQLPFAQGQMSPYGGMIGGMSPSRMSYGMNGGQMGGGMSPSWMSAGMNGMGQMGGYGGGMMGGGMMGGGMQTQPYGQQTPWMGTQMTQQAPWGGQYGGGMQQPMQQNAFGSMMGAMRPMQGNYGGAMRGMQGPQQQAQPAPQIQRGMLPGMGSSGRREVSPQAQRYNSDMRSKFQTWRNR